MLLANFKFDLKCRFLKNYTKRDAFEENKSLLKRMYEDAKVLSEKVNHAHKVRKLFHIFIAMKAQLGSLISVLLIFLHKVQCIKYCI